RIGWLRAAVLGANDGIVSVSSLVVGVAAGGATQSTILLTGIAGLVAGALSMAAGEYISVQSQADTENADLEIEKRELAEEPEKEPRPIQAALSSATAFALGAVIPIIASILASTHLANLVITITTLITLALLGVLAAFAGGASKVKGAIRVSFWGALAMGITALVGKLIGVSL
ncbi:UNVERIFIED_CONTAM: hypothetical protein GTU68_008296, partial [Idotea baltica]|nr:hypothetical protein [Idotea baltica]